MMAATASWGIWAVLAAAGRPQPQEPVFVLRTDTGLDFRHFRFATPQKKYLCETAGAGIGLLDFDRDGDLDVYCVQSCPLPGFPGKEEAPPDALYRNEGGLRFTPVAKCGLDDRRYGMGVSCPDVDNDGWPDLFVTNVGRDALYRNNRDGTFTDVTESSGIVDDHWSTCACFADLDGDGDLDLYLANYALIDFANYKVCGQPPDKISYCHPDNLKSAPDRLFRNDGGFKFTDVTKEAGIDESASGGKGFQVVPFDVNGDGRLDLFVANDADPNYLWINQGGLRFVDEAGWTGVAVSGKGASQSCMGVDLADVDGDLDFDLFATNFGKESNVLYVRNGEFFEDRTYPSGLGAPSYLFTGFGARFFDYDKDGDSDLMVVNGHIMDLVHEYDPSQTFEQVPHFYENRGGGRFESIGPRLSPFFEQPNVGRGLATGDLDGDGDLDVIVAENDHALALLENAGRSANGWIGFRLTGTRSPRDAIGAVVTIECEGRKQAQPVLGSSSYLSWGDLRAYFGVGPVDSVKIRASTTIHWPSGTVQRLEGLALGRYHDVSEPPSP
jgi:hypothetical protein